MILIIWYFLLLVIILITVIWLFCSVENSETDEIPTNPGSDDNVNNGNDDVEVEV